MIKSYVFIFLTVLLTIYGQIVIKWRVNLHPLSGDGQVSSSLRYILMLLLDPFVLSGLIAAFLASCTWMLAVSRMDLSKAYPFVAMSFILVPIASFWLLAEVVTIKTFIGGALIIVGIAVSVS